MADTDPSSFTTPKAEIKDDSVFTEGDMSLISSDNVRFRVPSFYLLAASGVMRDMYQSGSNSSSGSETIFTDPDIETAKAVRTWLQVITNSLPADHKHNRTAAYVFPLAKKYDCPQVAFTIISLLHKRVDKGDLVTLPNAIVAAADFGEVDLIAKIIRRGNMSYEPHPAGMDPNAARLSHTPGGGQTDPSAWSLEQFRVTPHDYIWALLRARSKTKGHAERADEFLSLMSVIDKKPEATQRKRKADEVEA